MTPCTQWYRHDPHANEWRFNHIQDGHSVAKKPTPKFESQKGWLNATWSAHLCWLTDDLPAAVVYYDEAEKT